ncbi:MAG: tetratricopeptide repeat protein [Nostoc sp. NMS1]|uniref:tetratricopeptide repeat protein n=1 Tax=unclassified Nostoc TaxID=2593658 RepID=UPI0025E4F135|nr:MULTISPECIES: tetratricopeptide repeat protein [unclassified Nostoc]MBN3908080.1 tetratricopeptide repeat protein [Nostoc sp. NMS1]MBN3990600.1 tetratricopeptide repeat protein [Nostoc sp. NMS2]
MLKLDSSTTNDLMEILRPFMESERERRTFLHIALDDKPVLQHIDCSGAVAIFMRDMVQKLANYGGEQYLRAILEYAREQVGEDVKQRIDKLLDKLQDNLSIRDDLSSPEAEYRKVVEERVTPDGKISVAGRHILDQCKQRLIISQEKAENIEKEVLQPFYEYQNSFDRFLEVLVKQIHNELPFSSTTRSDLKALHSQLKMKEVEALYIKLAHELYKQNKWEKSIHVYRELIIINKNNAICHQNLAYILLQNEQIDDAIAELREAIRIEPNNVKLYEGLGNSFYVKAQFDKAIEAYQQAIEISTDDAPSDLAKIHYLLGCTFCECERLEEAIKEYTQAIKIDTEYAEAYAELGNCQRRVENFLDAYSNLQTAIAIKRDNPNNSKFHRYLGMVMSSQGKYKDAIVEFEEAIKHNIINSTPDPITYTQYAFVLLAQRKQKQAETEIQLAIKLFQQQKMGDAANQMEDLYEKIKKESSWKSFFNYFFKS